jgi:hypothetical protein
MKLFGLPSTSFGPPGRRNPSATTAFARLCRRNEPPILVASSSSTI